MAPRPRGIPPGLAQLREAELSLVHSTGRRNRRFEGFRTQDGSSAFTTLATGNTTVDIEFASAAVPFRVAGRPRHACRWDGGDSTSWRPSGHGEYRRLPVTPAGRPAGAIRIDSSTEGSVNLWSLAGAVGVTNRLAVGWSLDLYRSGWEERSQPQRVPRHPGRDRLPVHGRAQTG